MPYGANAYKDLRHQPKKVEEEAMVWENLPPFPLISEWIFHWVACTLWSWIPRFISLEVSNIFMGDSDFTIEIHHGGKFVDSRQRLEYLGGMVVEDLHFEVDEWSLQEIVSQLKQLGYKGFAMVWYKEPGMDLKLGLREMKSDRDAMRMARSLVSSSCKHCEVYVVDGARKSNGIEITSSDANYVPEEGEDSGSGLLEVEVDAESEPSTEEEVFDHSADDGDHDDHFGFEVEDNDPLSIAFGGFTGPLNDKGTAAARTAEGDEGLREGDEQVGGISDGYETGDIDSYEGDSDDMIKRGGTLGFEKNNRVRCRVVCKGRKGKCKWVCFVSKVGGLDCFRIKTLNGKHTCGRNYSGRLASSSWISKKIANNISRGEEMKLATVIQTIQDKCMANISVGKAYWARKKAREEVHGRAIQQYAKLRDYCAEILRENPGSSLSILVYDDICN
ncbi:hypothetical protein Ahy_A07g034823 [Arachis hypogaea]|uniref:PB1-like domain-containing protein n=1 Tax=Arachis hypogaea TaxID=3818 RepID=A0A445CCT8_ARAHY|nr:hypothetical protein Ahy_A07g034823 [Arachis hypogaea]